MLHYKTYQKKENSEWVVFLHGLGGSSTIWYKQIKKFKEKYNLLFVDLRGHGKSAKIKNDKSKYSLIEASQDVIEILNHLKIKSAHFVGISLGTIIARNIGYIDSKKVKSFIFGGPITDFNLRSKCLIRLGSISKYFIPYMWLYKLFAWIMMPKRNHEASRKLFAKEAEKMSRSEFIKWFEITKTVRKNYEKIKKKPHVFPTLYLIGEEDYMFIKLVERDMKDEKNSNLLFIKKSGHVCNVDQPDEFNEKALFFIEKNT